eukprot:7694332-Heterocapsa_arctica.AAC.1
MDTKIKVEELQNVKEFVKCKPFENVKSRCRQTNWTICKQADCYGCYFKMNAVVDFEANDIKEEATIAIGGWKQRSYWKEADAKQKIEYVAYYLATRPMQRGRLSKFGA